MQIANYDKRVMSLDLSLGGIFICPFEQVPHRLIRMSNANQFVVGWLIGHWHPQPIRVQVVVLALY